MSNDRDTATSEYHVYDDLPSTPGARSSTSSTASTPSYLYVLPGTCRDSKEKNPERGIALTIATGKAAARKSRRFFLRKDDFADVADTAADVANGTAKGVGCVGVFAMAMCLFLGALVATGIFVLQQEIAKNGRLR